MGNPSSVIVPIFLALRGAYDSMTDTFNKVQILININTYRKTKFCHKVMSFRHIRHKEVL